ncbi:uncharacterized protein LOC103843061 [Brassica rapa]|uniref:uncharacterized protein LOC103843061 n=1 Tax=Brassica campestris TaxID=3711 RepID=UPI0004F180F7|nr:uncharacterized protein LOC103843061 [Brassica rapa]
MSSQRRQRRQAQRKRARERHRSMQTWRKQQPSFLCPVMSQKKSTCYVRQLEFHLKLHNRMPQDQHLSIQDFINRIPKEYLGADGELIVDSSRVLPILVEKGILLERDCPLTERIDDTVSEETKDCTRYYAKKVNKHMLHPGGNRMETLKKYELFHADLIEKLKGGVVSVGVSVYPSYSKLKHKQIYYPTKDELAGKTEHYAHVMVCTAHDYDNMKRLVYEFQESAGAEVCDEGYVRIYADQVNYFVEMEVEMDD